DLDRRAHLDPRRLVPQRSAARHRAAAPSDEELSRVPVHGRGPEGADQAVDVGVAQVLALGQQRGPDRELLHQQRERRAAAEADRAGEVRQEVANRKEGTYDRVGTPWSGIWQLQLS